MSTTAISAPLQLVAANWVWVEMVLARRFGRVPELARGDAEALESAIGGGSAGATASRLFAEVRVLHRRNSDKEKVSPPLWRAADFDGKLGQAMKLAQRLLADRLRAMYGSMAFDVWYIGAQDPVMELVLGMLSEDPADPDRKITIVRLPDAPAISDKRFRDVDVVSGLGLFVGLDFSEQPATGGDERTVTKLDAEAEIDLALSFEGPLFDSDEKKPT